MSRASSPLLFGLAPRGVCRAVPIARDAVGSYPTFSPLPNEASESKTSRRFSCAMPPRCSAGGIFSVALSVTQPHRAGLNPALHTEMCNSALRQTLRGRPLALPGALPFSPRRFLPRILVSGACAPKTYILDSFAQDYGVRTFLPAGLFRGPAQRSPGLPAAGYYSALPHTRDSGN